MNAWVEAGFGLGYASGRRELGVRGGAHFLLGDWGLGARVMRVTPKRTEFFGIARNDEFTEVGILAERVVGESENVFLFVGAGVSRVTGFRLETVQGSALGANAVDFEPVTGAAFEAGFQGALGGWWGVSGLASVSVNEEETMGGLTLNLRLGPVAR